MLLISTRLRPCPGYRVCGDGIVARRRERDWLLALVDGVGHGPRAAEATDALLAYLHETESESLETILGGCDRCAAGTRGAALALLSLPHDSNVVYHVGIGNVVASLWMPHERSTTLINHNGIVGRLRKIPPPMSYETEAHHLLLLHSDGISSRQAYRTMAQWDGELEAHADRLMALATERDDAGLLLAQIRPTGA